MATIRVSQAQHLPSSSSYLALPTAATNHDCLELLDMKIKCSCAAHLTLSRTRSCLRGEVADHPSDALMIK